MAVATHAEVSAFIREDPAFRQCLAEVARALDIGSFAPYHPATLGRDQRRLMLTGQGLNAVHALLVDAHDLVVRFAVASLREVTRSDIPDEEWPAGEEPDEEDADALIAVGGYSPLLLFHALCDLLVLRQEDPTVLTGYLTSLRLPGVRAWRTTLTRAYRQAVAAAETSRPGTGSASGWS